MKLLFMVLILSVGSSFTMSSSFAEESNKDVNPKEQPSTAPSKEPIIEEVSTQEKARQRLYLGGSDEEDLKVQENIAVPRRVVTEATLQKEVMDQIYKEEQEEKEEKDENAGTEDSNDDQVQSKSSSTGTAQSN